MLLTALVKTNFHYALEADYLSLIKCQMRALFPADFLRLKICFRLP